MASTWISLNHAKALASNNIKEIKRNKLSRVELILFVNEMLCK
jgi:hypothetical protein